MGIKIIYLFALFYRFDLLEIYLKFLYSLASYNQEFTFKGWCITNKNCTNYKISGTYTFTQSNITLYPVWEAQTSNEYKAYFESNGGTWADGTTANKTITYKDKLSFDDSRLQISKPGYTLTGWKIKGTTTVYNQNIDGTDNGKTLVAVWEKSGTTTPTTNKVTFDTKGGTLYIGGIKTSSNTVLLTTLNLANYTAYKDNYTFEGWGNENCDSPLKKALYQ